MENSKKRTITENRPIAEAGKNYTSLFITHF